MYGSLYQYYKMWTFILQIAYSSIGDVFMAFSPPRPNMEYWHELQYVDGKGNIYKLYGDGGALTIINGITTVFPAPPKKEDVLKSSKDGSYTRFFPNGSVEQRYNGGELQKWGPPVECKKPNNWVFVDTCHMCGEYCNNSPKCEAHYIDSYYDNGEE